MSLIRTLSGKHFDFLNIDPESICIEDIAAALSNLCRFTGHLDHFYSVAQHSVLTSYLVPPQLAMEALLHDAAEAYCNDISSPLKALLPDYRAILGRVEAAVIQKFGLPEAKSRGVKYADLVMLATERRDLDLDDGLEIPELEGIEPSPMMISPLMPRQAQVLFLQRYQNLKGEQHGY